MQCNKTGFKTLDQANTRAKELNKKNKKQRRKNSRMRGYECQMCGEFHLTHESMDEFRIKNQESANVVDPDVISNRIKQLQEQMEKSKVKPLCPNCKETVQECGCKRNKCARCGEPVGNVTFTVCDTCWDIEFPKA